MRALLSYESGYAPGSTCVNRPVRRPGEEEARNALALDLTRGWYGPRPERAARIMWLPLMDVALNGIDGMAIAQARTWRKAA